MEDKKKGAGEQVYEPAELIAAYEVFKVPQEIVAGALYGDDTPMTVKDAKVKVKEFLNKEVTN